MMLDLFGVQQTEPPDIHIPFSNARELNDADLCPRLDGPSLLKVTNDCGRNSNLLQPRARLSSVPLHRVNSARLRRQHVAKSSDIREWRLGI